MNPLEVAPPAAPVDALEQVRLDGAIFFRGELTESWSFDSPLREMAGVIRPGATRLILFHIVVHGRCWTAVDGGDRHWVEQGDVIVLPYGDDYLMGGVEPAERVPILSLLAPPPWATMPVLTHGSGGARTDVVCGYLQSQDPLFDPSIRAFPPVFVVRLPDGPAAQWVASSIKFALDATTRISPTTPVSTRLPELLLIEVLLQHFADAPVSDHGWIAALRDPVLASAMTVVGLGTTRMWHLAVRSNGNAVARQVRGARTLGEFAQRLIAPGVCSTVGMLPSPERRTGTRCAPRTTNRYPVCPQKIASPVLGTSDVRIRVKFAPRTPTTVFWGRPGTPSVFWGRPGRELTVLEARCSVSCATCEPYVFSQPRC